ncbi:MAG: amidohydrolase [Sulfobacillus acidophilus]|uniref:Amidohydrolase n=1 Tax=Sulfobacillus acidophilus TaxID=53633 RepID=A0A2T2WGT2_9FIRM|nr:MAG: amidohydrolase [Sulfobacillus acidophilus]
MLIDDPIWDSIEPWMIGIRRDIHRYPELGLDTARTAQRVEAALHELGIAHERIIANGIKAVMGPSQGHAVLLRADMDALPLDEMTDLPFKSEISGRMHACGHDAHTAMVLGAAYYLQQRADQLRHPVVLMFQPAEEGPGGAKPMIEAGVLSNPAVQRAAMVHVNSRLRAGQIGLRSGQSNGACDDFVVIVHGRGGHGSSPHLGVDAIVVAAAIVQSVQTLVSREQDPFDPLVVTFGTIRGGYRENVLADRVELTGTIRSMTSSTRQRIVERFVDMVTSVAKAYQTSVDVSIDRGYPPLVADPTWSLEVNQILQRELGEDRITTGRPTLGVEDFAYVAERVPALSVSVGIVGPQFTTGLHSAGLIIDESALRVGACALAAIGLYGIEQ